MEPVAHEKVQEVSDKLDMLLMKYPELSLGAKATQAAQVLPVEDRLMMNPEILSYLTVKQVCGLRELSSTARSTSEATDTHFYHSLWEVASNEFGLYHPIDCHVTKELFLTELWPHAKKKWGASSDEDATGTANVKVGESFNIQVMARMRPGSIGTDKMNLPLHQFLKLKRRENLKKKEQQQGEEEEEEEKEKKKQFLGEKDPAEFVCPFTQTLMREPVLLTHCNRVVDRSIVGSGRDPWTGRRLDPSAIVPQPELQRVINEWRVEKAEKNRCALELDRDSIKEHIIEQQQGADPVLLAALMEAEKIAQESDRIFRLGSRAGLGGDKDGDDGPATDSNHDTDGANGEVVNGPVNNASSLENNARAAAAGVEEEEEEEEEMSGCHKNRDDAPRIIDICEPKACISMNVGGAGVKNFDFDKVFKGETSQEQFYNRVRDKSVTLALHGFNACFLAYGQTGSGKTFCFFGPDSMIRDHTAFRVRAEYNDLHKDCGVSIRICQDLLVAKERLGKAGVGLSITMNYVELYDEKATDLFIDDSAEIMVRKNGEVVGACEVPLEDLEQTLQTLRGAQLRKRFSATAMNDRSSRSHSVLIFNLTQVRSGKILQSVLHCVDLAGSERLKRSKAVGVAKREAVTINRSLLVLGKVIEGLATGKSHIPYLESKLTTLLRSAFGGNSRTTVNVCARAEDSSGSETLSSLRFGERASAISNSIKQCASSAEETLASLTASLESIGTQVESLRERGKERFAEKLLASYKALEQKRNELVSTMLTAQHKERGGAPGAWALKTTAGTAKVAAHSPLRGTEKRERFAVVEAQ